MEPDLLDANAPAQRPGQGSRLLRGANLRPRVEKFADASQRSRAAQQLAPDLRQSTHRTGCNHRVQHKLREHTGVHFTGEHRMGACPKHQGDGAESQQDHQCREPRRGGDAMSGGLQRQPNGVGISLALARLPRVGLHGVDCIDRLRCHGRGIGNPVLTFARQLLDPAPEHHDGQDHGGNDQGGESGQARTGHDQHHGGTDQHEQAAQ